MRSARGLWLFIGEEIGEQTLQEPAVFGFRKPSQREAAIDTETLAGYERSGIAQKEYDTVGDVLGLAQSCEGHLADEAVARGGVLGEGRGRFGLDQAWEHRVHTDACRPHSSATTLVSVSTPAFDAE